MEKAPLPPQASPSFPIVKNLRFQRAKLTDCRQGCPHHMARVSKEGLLRGILKKKKNVFSREEKLNKKLFCSYLVVHTVHVLIAARVTADAHHGEVVQPAVLEATDGQFHLPERLNQNKKMFRRGRST